LRELTGQNQSTSSIRIWELESQTLRIMVDSF
jgi:hypothetical protein